MGYKNKEDAQAYQQKRYQEKKQDAAWYEKMLADGRARNKTERHRARKRQRRASYKGKLDYIVNRYKVNRVQAAEIYERNIKGICENCGGGGEMHIDHCHTCLVVRAVLCEGCNMALGSARDNPTTLRGLANLIERTACNQPKVTVSCLEEVTV